ncbi:MAG: DUF72 domain-containing protein [Desulfurococcales archaeon]|nr:DUF72 domain-containing protein [Desulfurococcales archaeon]
MKEVIVGTCGFSKSRKLIFRDLDAVEIQETFYDPPPRERLIRLREEAPETFEFTVKAWMLVTHNYNKMLWKRLKREVPGRVENYGSFQDTEEVWWAWEETLNAAEALKARIIVLQTPASFTPTRDNIKSVTNFLSKAPRRGHLLAWEPRGEWWDNRELLSKIANEYDVIIAGDFLRGRLPPAEADIAYGRLHGLGGKEVNYKYKYTDDDLRRLLEIVEGLTSKRVYVMFNNVYSYYDAVRFKQLFKAQPPN